MTKRKKAKKPRWRKAYHPFLNSHQRGHLIGMQQGKMWARIHQQEARPQPVKQRLFDELTTEERERFGL